MTKSIYLLQDLDRIGLHLQLVNQCLEVISHIYVVNQHQEFSEFFHLCLFAFDKVCDFYKEQLFEEVLIKPVLDALVKVIELLNSVPQEPPSSQQIDPKTYSSERSQSEQSLAHRFKQPFTETLYRNTENVQRVLRRAVFRYHYSKE